MTLKNLEAEIANHSAQVAAIFKPGCKVTILVRNPGVEGGLVLVTDDDINLAIASLQKLQSKEERKLTPGDVIRNAIREKA